MNGELLDSGIVQSRHFIWKVPKFFDLPIEPDYYFLQSPEFRFAGDLYCLRLYPNGAQVDQEDLQDNSDQEDETSVDVDVLLFRLSSSVPEIDISYEIGYKSDTGDEFRFEDTTWSDGSVGGIIFYNERSVIEKKKDIYVPDGILTLYCRILISSELSVASLHGVQKQKESPGVDKLQSDFRRLLLKGAESDACLVVCGKEFQAHRNVLRARSPVFEAMFHLDTAEKESGRVVIDDLKPERFQDFLEYLYTGRVEAFSDDNAFGLYAAADKYDVPTLKMECVEYMSRSLSVDSICDVINVALSHNEKDLMALAVEFFKNNLTSILLTVKWQRLLSENSTRGNELLIKALVPGKESKQSTSTVECSSTTVECSSTK